ncbi:D-alanyl-D-alanine carboxypeptidase family protein [Micromonospora sp. NPDC049102]|uniref:D-alanyl-D-alanine carboxypeptidase family protein n=1 Tax=Micromonospora sp. NPDC049102 TaxID=3364265 RepID=UPI003723B9A2
MRAALLAVTASAILLAAAPVTAAAADPTPVAATEAAATGAVAAGPAVRCPRTPAPAVSRPPRPSPPPAVPEARVVGGAGLATSGLVVPAGVGAPPAITATSWLVADLDSGQVLGGCGPHEYGTPASVQKLLLVATMMPRLDPTETVTVTEVDMNIEPGSSAVGLVEGGRYTIETIWLGLLLNSGNEAANALARLGGGPDGAVGGVRAMNERAHDLGALQTHAVTPSGLDGKGQFTSAYDLALIARACFVQPAFRRYALTELATIPAQPAQRTKGFQIQNDDQLIYRYPGALGGKTGFTDLARHTYVGAAERNGRRLVVTLLGAEPAPMRGWEQGAALLDWGFSLPRDAGVGRLVEPGELTATPSATPSALAAPIPPRPAAASGPAHTGSGWLWTVVALSGATVLALLGGLLWHRRRRLPGQIDNQPRHP